MNHLIIIGNLTRDPELRTTPNGTNVCSFTVAVNRRQKNSQGQTEADYFNVSAWRELGVNCANYLAKGRKVAVTGSVSVRTYQRNDGGYGANMEVQASNVEFLSPKGEVMTEMLTETMSPTAKKEFTQVQMDDEELPF